MILNYLSRYKGLGKNSIAKFLRMKPQTFENGFEPYLIYKEFIEVSSRRKLTEKGKEFLNKLNKGGIK
jgi:Holliday junction resolvasome RuvABC ATP-dependent DNA helicase subunit